MTTENTFLVELTPAEPSRRVDALVAEQFPQISRTQIQKLIRNGSITVDGMSVKVSHKLFGGEAIRVRFPEPDTDDTLQPMEFPLEVLYEDAGFAVLNKPYGIIMHPGQRHERHTLAHAILARYPEVGEMVIDVRRRGIVHRLDKDTSGVVLIARTLEMQTALAQQFADRTTEKEYIALLERAPRTPTGRIDAPIGHAQAGDRQMSVVAHGRSAITEYAVIDRDFTGGQALVNVKIFTGRTHQIRVHMAFIGAPIVGDPLYGYSRQRVNMSRQFLHAARLSFTHPTTGERISVSAPLPPDLQAVLAYLKGGPPV
jgi:23S rRNA pseudouridine1911/1915/1917 synthase